MRRWEPRRLPKHWLGAVIPFSHESATAELGCDRTRFVLKEHDLTPVRIATSSGAVLLDLSDQLRQILSSPIAPYAWALLVQTGLPQEAPLLKFMFRVAACTGLFVHRRVDRLTPRTAGTAPRRSLSGLYGTASFPMHSDGAHWSLPPRLSILGAARVCPHSAKTLLARAPALAPSDYNIVARGVYVVRNGSRSFLASICRRTRPFVRFDRGCMTPIDTPSRTGLDLYATRLGEVEPSEIAWNVGDVLVVNNWTTLHGRTEAEADGRRLLLRIFAGGRQ